MGLKFLPSTIFTFLLIFLVFNFSEVNAQGGGPGTGGPAPPAVVINYEAITPATTNYYTNGAGTYYVDKIYTVDFTNTEPVYSVRAHISIQFEFYDTNTNSWTPIVGGSASSNNHIVGSMGRKTIWAQKGLNLAPGQYRVVGLFHAGFWINGVENPNPKTSTVVQNFYVW